MKVTFETIEYIPSCFGVKVSRLLYSFPRSNCSTPKITVIGVSAGTGCARTLSALMALNADSIIPGAGVPGIPCIPCGPGTPCGPGGPGGPGGPWILWIGRLTGVGTGQGHGLQFLLLLEFKGNQLLK
ncbi:hypothetical protein COL91_12550 [Bacillus pseudomycoides]|nr:hypothetical protein COO02_18670 [Bacillus pseudomycoides]PGA90706.1 hypothetical protein COL91_12550 [Bacillus pseudomycoides]PHF50640.1 hypothetical protein COF72_03430 [Bacillus pseudomycoides]